MAARYSESVVAALASLSPEHRAVVVLRYLLEYTPGEIAEALELPRGTVNSRLRRALDRLGKQLEGGAMSELRLAERLREVFVPEEREAEVRGWRVVHGAFEARHPVHLRPRLNRLAIALALGLADRRHRAEPGRRQGGRPGSRRGRARRR